MTEWLTAAAVVAGTTFMLLTSVGILRFADFYVRVHASSTAATLGLFFLVLALAFHHLDLAIGLKVALVYVFSVLTLPLSAHLLVRAAHRAEELPTLDLGQPDRPGPAGRRTREGDLPGEGTTTLPSARPPGRGRPPGSGGPSAAHRHR